MIREASRPARFHAAEFPLVGVAAGRMQLPAIRERQADHDTKTIASRA